MGNRSRFVAFSVGAAAAAAAVAQRRARWRRVAEGIREAILPTATAPGVTAGGGDDEAHARGHRHLRVRSDSGPSPQRARSRPWMKREHGLRQSGTG